MRGERSEGQPCQPQISGHPRACGENGQGLPQAVRSGRAIPARAGRTQGHPCISGGLPGPSPRVRGEHRLRLTMAAIHTGHPRACGENGDLLPAGAVEARAIPARAGRTPRKMQVMLLGIGPSPRVRGELAMGLRSETHRPGHPRACGENSWTTTGGATASAGHPRACGENAALGGSAASRRSGHPRACGENSQASAARLFTHRAIPARAGRTVESGKLTAVQFGPSPRVRGERRPSTTPPPAMTGPSPRVRGERVVRLLRRGCV